MTIPAEELSALRRTRRFLTWILCEYNSKTTVSEVRKMAIDCVRHFPMDHNLDATWNKRIKAWESELDN